ncbi:PREDICTED: alpha-tocopherol transfer protein-like [Cyphomyrmex costatus]|uniref:Alpha-tocopherol transfer protein-like protein n=1 Tax=Cyphomyrmex costatus TaxID=456900 RepID=A0A195D4M7_9HYME|nr:PREDICTED: alpha-tocopherol transfer protein-like [Cyphomyrmex costatus]KYN07796.1 Alpha-tocopherol transfer protein-like protein [Cyphomyrmex costatus]
MPQENEKSSNCIESRTPAKDREFSTGSGSEDPKTVGKQTTDVKEQENLESCKGADNMPELENYDEFDDEQITLDLSEPPPEVMEYSRRELGETEEVKCQTLQEFRDMIYERGECLPHRMDDAFLIRFLRARNFNIKSAHKLIVNYYNFKEEHPEIHQQLNSTEMRYIGEDDVITVPPYRTQCGRRLMIYRFGNWDPRKYPAEMLFKATVGILEIGMLEPRQQIMGGIAIFDLKDISMTHAWSVTPQVASMMLSVMVTAFPIRIHALHILNQSWVFDAIFAVFKPLLDANMRNKLFFHGNNYESLHKHILPQYLPKVYGGVRKELPYYKWIQSIIEDPKIVEEMNKMGYVVTDEIRDSFS